MPVNFFNNNYVCGLDISSGKIAACLVKLRKRAITEAFFEEAPSRGIKKGAIFDSIELVSCVEKVLNKLKSRSGINIKYVYADISGEDVSLKHSKAIIPLADRGNKVISLSDIEKVNEQARILGSSLEEEIIGQVPYSYGIDSKSNIANPFGLYSHKLEADLYLVSVKLSSVQNLSRVISQAGFELKDLFFSPFATAAALFSDSMRKGVNVLCDLGSDITEILIFKDSMLKNAEILHKGGKDLTEHLSAAFKIPFDLAEEVKISHGSIQDPGRVDQNKEILIKRENAYMPIKQKEVIECLVSKADEICSALKQKLESSVEIDKIDNFFVCGQTALMEGLLEMLEGKLGIPVRLGRLSNRDFLPLANNSDVLGGHKYLTYATCIGIVSKAINEDAPLFMSAAEVNSTPVSKIIGKLKEVYQEYF